jgi:hypothetical protein
VSWGLETYDATGAPIIFSPNYAASYYLGYDYGGSSAYSPSAGLYRTLDFCFAGARADYSDRPYRFYDDYAWNLDDPDDPFIDYRAYGVVDSSNVYHPPAKTERGARMNASSYMLDNIRRRSRLYVLGSNMYKFGRVQSTDTSFGLSITGRNSHYIVDGLTSPLFYQPLTGNSYVGTGYATSSYVSSGGYFASRTANIVFPQPYDTPPLIFITDTGGVGVTLYGFTLDSSGRYAGAIITSERPISLKNPGFLKNNAHLDYAHGSTSCTFKYFLLSPKFPSYSPLGTSHGLIVRSTDGSTIFDSRLSVGDTQSVTFSTPYYRVSPTESSVQDHVFTNSSRVNTYSGSFPAGTGVCINGFSPISGCLMHAGDSGQDVFRGFVSILGRFLSVTSSGSVSIYASGSGYSEYQYSSMYSYGYYACGAMALCYDFHGGVAPTMSAAYISP